MGLPDFRRWISPDRQALAASAAQHNSLMLDTLHAAGYRIYLTFQVMEITLDEPPAAPEWPAGIRPRQFRPGIDEQVTYEADEAASRDKGYYQPLDFEAWQKRMNMQHADFDLALWLLAWDEAEVAGVALNMYASQAETGWIDHLGVRPGWRKQGLGLALMRAGMQTVQRYHWVSRVVDE